MPGRFFRWRAFLLLIGGTAAAVPAAFGDRLDEQRAAFRDAYARAEVGDRDALETDRRLLEGYVLWPDLEAAYLRARLDTVEHAVVRRFLERYRDLKPARALRYRFALHLADEERHDEYLELYEAHYRDLGVERLDCLALAADLAAGRSASVLERARPLWLVGHSQVDACDPVFEHLRASGQLTEALYRERFELAVAARSLSLARYLARSLPEPYGLDAARWTRAYGEPRAFLEGHDTALESATYRQQLLAAVETLAYDEPLEAARYWDRIAAGYAFEQERRLAIERHLALWVARNHEATADAFLKSLPEQAIDVEVLRWRVRNALSVGDWPVVIAAIDRLPPAERGRDAWQYWRAMAMRQTGGDDGARAILERLTADRSYYGFLAADVLDRAYPWSHAALEPDEAVLGQLARDPAIVRARELFLVDLEGRGRSEWNTAVGALDRDGQVQAAILAHRWGWHSQAITTAAETSRYDDLHIRYPLPYPDEFERASAAAGIRTSWAYGIARSESLFMRDVRSPAGAIGLMQLRPSTGRWVAKSLDETYGGRAALTDAATSIRLGTSYLGSMSARFDDNRVLATAAYNAGPLRVEAWLPRHGDVDARVWVETIPYQETRDYVRRVLTAEAIFHWRLAGETRRLSADMPNVTAMPAVARVAPR